ncbi:hypothetical protein HOY82DRAFT_635072 [Tuber indicum]|nr:hypothetical protein HOY82DRAFT_635072 [Tuber indicum]
MVFRYRDRSDRETAVLRALFEGRNPPPTTMQLLKKFTGYNKVASLFGRQEKEEEIGGYDGEFYVTYNHLFGFDSPELNFDGIVEDLIDHVPEVHEFYTDRSPSTLHFFQLITLILNEIQANLDAVAGIRTREPPSPEDIVQIQEGGSFHHKNNLARAMNSKITVTTMGLHPLYGVNGEPIKKFPKTGADIRKLKGKRINKLLLALGLRTNGTLSERKQRFMKYIGFTMLLSF